MTVLHLGFFGLAAAIIGQLRRGRELVLLGVSVFVLYWMQPPQQFVSLAFWLPTASIALTIFVWVSITPREFRNIEVSWPAAAVITCVVVLLDLSRLFSLENIYMTATPSVWMVAAAGGFYLMTVLAAGGLAKRGSSLPGGIFLAIILLFVYLKSPFLINSSLDLISKFHDPGVRSPHQILSWLGFSYIAFRLMHTIRDHQLGRLSPSTLSEYVNYVIFFPSISAGPIDRVERFVKDLRTPEVLTEQDWLEAGRRVFLGLFKKFVVADSLALIALNDVLVGQAKTAAWLWLFVYAYSLRIFFDFSGYTDMAIGFARLMRVRLPENFTAPYLKPNLAQFWNSWHITLAQWFRTYFFNPLTRILRIQNFPAPLTIFMTQILTMLLIGLWHGVTSSFALWGLWHGLGLFIQNRWSAFTSVRIKTPPDPARQMFLNAFGIFLTFNFVSLGWLFFTLSTPALAWQAMLKLFSITA